MIKLSRVSKLDGIRSWSTPAGKSCPASKDSEVCEGCYAKFGNYNYSNVKEPREHNMKDWRRSSWCDDMIKELDNDRYFRWFDSGDLMNITQALKILKVMKNTPWVKHWMPTLSYNKIPALKAIMEEMNQLPNVVVRASSKIYNVSVSDKEIQFSSKVITNENNATGYLCEAYKNKDKNCNGCRACWDKDIKEINYYIHGKVALSKAKKKNIL